MSAVARLHEDWAWFLIGSNALVGIWALLADRVHALRVKALWWCTGVAQLACFVQAGLGAAALGDADRSRLQFHMLYGFSTLVAVGVLYSYRAQLKHRLYLLYGLGGLFIMGLGFRAIYVG